MKIGIDATCWWNQRGFGRFTRELLKAIFTSPDNHQYYLFVDQAPVPEMVRDNIHIIQVLQSKNLTEAATSTSSRSIKDMWMFRKAVKDSNIDLMFFPAVYSWFPTPFSVPVVVTFHDAIAEHFPELIFPDWKGKLFWDLKVLLARWHARRFLTVSHAAKEEITRYIGISANKIDVISEAPDPHFRPIVDTPLLQQARKNNGLKDDARLLLYVGGLAPHKNLLGMLKGLSIALQNRELDDIHLVLIGDLEGAGFHSHYEELCVAIKDDSLLQDRVHFTGYISDEDLVALYSDALAVVMPSFSEGFGLPAIEAMACNTPVLSSTSGSLPEVVGDAGLYFDPHQPTEIADAIERLSTDKDLQNELREKAKCRALTFTWDNAAKLALKYLDAVVHDHQK
jgi:glycosyltransferase involved in cell wall biosynthesis